MKTEGNQKETIRKSKGKHEEIMKNHEKIILNS